MEPTSLDSPSSSIPSPTDCCCPAMAPTSAVRTLDTWLLPKQEKCSPAHTGSPRMPPMHERRHIVTGPSLPRHLPSSSAIRQSVRVRLPRNTRRGHTPSPSHTLGHGAPKSLFASRADRSVSTVQSARSIGSHTMPKHHTSRLPRRRPTLIGQSPASIGLHSAPIGLHSTPMGIHPPLIGLHSTPTGIHPTPTGEEEVITPALRHLYAEVLRLGKFHDPMTLEEFLFAP